MNLNLSKLLYAFAFTVLLSCSDDENDITPTIIIEKSTVIENYTSIVYANYSDTLTDAESLETSITTFINTPTENNFTAAKEAWLNARESYGPTEAYRFYDGPIDNATTEHKTEILLKHIPIPMFKLYSYLFFLNQTFSYRAK